MEFWDAYDSDLNKIEGVTLIRGKPIPHGMLHLVCSVIVQHTDGTYLLMKRDPHKHYGGMWEASAGGSVLKGESPAEGALRELREETGIIADKLTDLGPVVNEKIRSIHWEFMCITDIDKDCITLQVGETVDYKWVSRKELLSIPQREIITPMSIMKQIVPDLKGE